MSVFDIPPTVGSTITGMAIYEDCHHRWWVRAWDRLRGRGHPSGHLLAWGSPTSNNSQSGITIDWAADGTFRVRDQ